MLKCHKWYETKQNITLLHTTCNIQQATRRKEVEIDKNGKTYRIKQPMAQDIVEISLKYMNKNGCIVNDAKIANAIMKKGIETATEEDITKYLNEE